MHLKHYRTLLPAQEGAAKICALSWSSDNKKFAVCTFDRVVLLFDEMGEMKDKFSTRPCDPKYGKKSYMVKGVAFSPDGTKIAVGQTDDIVYVYKIGKEWGEKKTICNKFIYKGAVTSLIWLPSNHLIYGTSDGKVRLANTKTNKSSTLYDTKFHVVSLAKNPEGSALLSGHADGSIVKFYVEEANQNSSGKICYHPCPPYALAWANNAFMAGGCDKKIFSYSLDGRINQQFDFSKDEEEKEFGCAVASPSGQSVVFASFDRIKIFNWNHNKSQWEEGVTKVIKGLYTITCLSFKEDATKLYAGSLCGAVEIFDSCLKKTNYKDKFEISHVGTNQIIIKSLLGRNELSIRSRSGKDLNLIKILPNDSDKYFVLLNTIDTLVIGDLSKKLISEINWPAFSKKEKFSFDYEDLCLIYNCGELLLVELGKDAILMSVRTEFPSKHLISIRLNEKIKNFSKKENKKIAYLIDLKTVSIIDIISGFNQATITHNNKINWIELNESGSKLLIRDNKMKLFLYDVATSNKTTFLSYCIYAQWVPGSDVIVAQDRSNVCIWYNSDLVDKMELMHAKGEIISIEKTGTKNEILMKDGMEVTRIPLNEGEIVFKTSLEDGDLARAVLYLESLPPSSEVDFLWLKLSEIANENKNYIIAERCYSALQNVTRASYLHDINLDQSLEDYKIQAKIALLDNNYELAEKLYAENGELEELLVIYEKLYKWEQAINLSELRNISDTNMLKKKYYIWLMETNQEEKAGDLKVNEDDFQSAISLYCTGGVPAKASRLLIRRQELLNNPDLVDKVTSCLMKSEMYDKVGEIYEKIGKISDSIDIYRKGGFYKRVIELARNIMPEKVVQYEEEWGDYLVKKRMFGASIAHFIEAGCTNKAIEAAINGHQWGKACEILEVVGDNEKFNGFYDKISNHYASTHNFEVAEKFYLKSGKVEKAVQMYNQNNKWVEAHQLASKYMNKEEADDLSLKQAKQLEEGSKFKDAEKLYLVIGKKEECIEMYRKNRLFDDMLRMVRQFRPDKLKETHFYLAKIFESENKLKMAEHHYLEAKEADLVISMYKKEKKWEDAYRIAKTSGSAASLSDLVYNWSKSLGYESGVKILNKLNMFDKTLDYAMNMEEPDFEWALEMSRGSQKASQICLKYAEDMEKKGMSQVAEDLYLRAGATKEAILMYINQKDLTSAQRVAEMYDQNSLEEVLVAQGQFAFEAKQFQKGESLFLRAQRPELVIEAYKTNNMWPDAIRVCKEYFPNLVEKLERQNEKSSKSEDGGEEDYQFNSCSPASNTIASQLKKAQEHEARGEYAKAVKCYVEINISDNEDVPIVEKCYKKASELAVKFLSSENSQRVVEILAPRLQAFKRYNTAADLYLQVDMVREAVDSLVACGEWNKAKIIANEFDPKLIPYIDELYKNDLKDKNKLETLESVDMEAALERYISQNEWSKALNLAEKKSSKVLIRVLNEYCSKLAVDGKCLEVLEVLNKYQVVLQNLNLYKRIFYEVANLTHPNSKHLFRAWSRLRDVLFKLNSHNSVTSSTEESSQLFNKMFLVSHYYSVKWASEPQQKLRKIGMKLSLSILRHIDIVPPDKAFYQAGISFKELNQDQYALMYLNRFLDIIEAIEEQNSSTVDLSMFEGSDVPVDISLPQNPCLDNDQIEEAKEWVLAKSMNTSIDTKLPLTSEGTYVASLVQNKTQLQPCCLTGFPIFEDSSCQIFGGNNIYKVLKDDWEEFLSTIKLTKDEDLQNVYKFIIEWLGNPSE